MSDDRAYQIRTVHQLIQVLNRGDDGAAATRQMLAILERLATLRQDHGGEHKATLTPTIEFLQDERGVDVKMKSASKGGEMPVMRERYFMTPDNFLTMQDPGRESLFRGQDMGRRPGPRPMDESA